jgi:hypothetical protein
MIVVMPATAVLNVLEVVFVSEKYKQLLYNANEMQIDVYANEMQIDVHANECASVHVK